MNSSTEPVENTPSSLVEVIRTRWLNVRRKRFWALCLLLLYTVFGFFVAPILVKSNVISLFQDDLERTARLESVQVNPFVLSLRARGFEVEDKDATRLMAFEEFYVNFQLSSLFNRAWTFSRIHLIAPYFFVERFDKTDSRLARIATDFSNSRPGEPESEQTSEGMPRLLIHDLSLTEGHLDLKDNLPGTAVQTRLTPINISIQDLNTLPDRHGKQSVTIQLPDNATLKWSGSLTLAPLDSQGELVMENLRLDPLITYLQSSFPLESASATLSTRFQYRVNMPVGGQPDVDINDMDVELDNVAISGLEPATEFVSSDKISLAGGVLLYPEQSIQFTSLTLDRPRLIAWLNENGNLSLSDLSPANEDTAASEPPSSVENAWQIGVDDLDLANGSLSFSDNSLTPNAALDVTDLQVSMSGINNQGGTTIPVKLAGNLEQGGSFNLDGNLILLPDLSITGGLSTRDLPLSLGQPYLQQFARIEVNEGVLNSDIDLSFTNGQNLVANGSVRIPGLDVFDTLDQQQLVGWKTFDIDRLEFDLEKNSLQFSLMTFDQSFGRFVIDEDRSTNLSKLIIEQSDDKTEPQGEPLDIVIGGIVVKDSTMDFSDLSLPLPFATRIGKLNGRIATIDTSSDAPANIKLEGQVDEFGLARIDGGMDMFDPIRYTDVSVEFRNLMMSSLSPYTVQFAGREIDEGKLNLELEYVIKEGLLQGGNNVLLSDLVLGKEVDHPEAASLPLGLAVSLLKDADGLIKIDLPVTGDINDPEFQIGGVVWQAISGLITKVVSAPFRLLGNLIGIDSEDFGQFEFLAGRADLTPPELEKVVQLEKALEQRPELVIEISGVMDRSIDTLALKKIKLISVASERLGQEFGSRDDQTMMLDDEIRSVVEQMFVERFPDVSLDDLKAGHTVPPAADPNATPVLDQLAYATDLWYQLLASEPVSDQELLDLAQARAQAIRSAFLASGKFDEQRIVISEPKEVETEDDEWVKLDLAVASK